MGRGTEGNKRNRSEVGDEGGVERRAEQDLMTSNSCFRIKEVCRSML
jgi:hypothetical protein